MGIEGRSVFLILFFTIVDSKNNTGSELQRAFFPKDKDNYPFLLG